MTCQYTKLLFSVFLLIQHFLAPGKSFTVAGAYVRWRRGRFQWLPWHEHSLDPPQIRSHLLIPSRKLSLKTPTRESQLPLFLRFLISLALICSASASDPPIYPLPISSHCPSLLLPPLFHGCLHLTSRRLSSGVPPTLVLLFLSSGRFQSLLSSARSLTLP